MPIVQYHSGDTICLKTRMRGSIQPQGTGRIVTSLPETQGAIRYRVRLQGENFDRTISEDDIDRTQHHAPATTETDNTEATDQKTTGSSWIDLSAVRTRK